MSPLLKQVLMSSVLDKISEEDAGDGDSTGDSTGADTVADALLKIHADLDFYKTDLDYNIIYNLEGVANYDDAFLTRLTQFINDNYMKQNHKYDFFYTKELLAFFLNGESVIITFHEGEAMIGCVLGSAKDVMGLPGSRGESVKSMECNFLCLVREYNRFVYINYCKNILKLASLNIFGITNMFFAKTKLIENRTHFSKRAYYHRPVCINSLVRAEFLPEIYNRRVQKKVYGTFGYNRHFIQGKRVLYNHDPDFHLDVGTIYEKLIAYNDRHYTIYDIKTRDDLEKILSSPCFHAFFITGSDAGANGDAVVLNFVCFYELEFRNKVTGVVCKNAYFYTGFFEDKYTIRDVFEFVHDYMYKYTDIAVTTILDIFGYSEQEFSLMKFLRSPGKLYYFFDNTDIIGEIESVDNGIIPI